MARQFTTPLVLPADPTAALQAATKQYVDNRTPSDPVAGTAGLRTLGTGAQQAAVGSHTHAYVLSSDEGVANGVATLDAATRLPVAQLPYVLSAIRAGSFATAYTPDASGAGNIINITATGNLTISAPTNPVDGQQLRLNVLASGAARTVTFSGVAISTGLTVGPYAVAQNQILLALLTYSTLRTTPAWILISCTVSA